MLKIFAGSRHCGHVRFNVTAGLDCVTAFNTRCLDDVDVGAPWR